MFILIFEINNIYIYIFIVYNINITIIIKYFFKMYQEMVSKSNKLNKFENKQVNLDFLINLILIY